jgi:hypothetical protein
MQLPLKNLTIPICYLFVFSIYFIFIIKKIESSLYHKLRKIDAAGMPGMAAAKSPHREPESFKNSMFLQGFFGIIRAAGIKPAAVSDQGTDRPLIEPDESD